MRYTIAALVVLTLAADASACGGRLFGRLRERVQERRAARTGEPPAAGACGPQTTFQGAFRGEYRASGSCGAAEFTYPPATYSAEWTYRPAVTVATGAAPRVVTGSCLAGDCPFTPAGRTAPPALVFVP